MRAIFALPIVLAALSGCSEGESSTPTAASDARPQAAREATETALRGRLRAAGALHQRGVQVFAQALPDTIAVCGRANTSGSASDPFMPYVAVVSFDGAAARVSNLALGTTGPEASRVFLEMVDRCFEGGGPATTRVTARAMPPLPSGSVAAEPAGAGVTLVSTAAAAPAPAETPRMTNTVMTSSRHGANIRSSTRNGEVVRTVPPSSTLEVLADAPGGWYQVGERGTPWGWVHASVLDMASR